MQSKSGNLQCTVSLSTVSLGSLAGELSTICSDVSSTRCTLITKKMSHFPNLQYCLEAMASSGKKTRPRQKRKMMMILDVNPVRSRYSCLLTTCTHKATTIPTVLSHLWKFNSHNGATKKCTGQKSSSLHVYPALFEADHADRTIKILSKEYTDIDWSFVGQCINQRPPDLCSLIRIHDFMVTGEYVQRHQNCKIPESLKGYGWM